VKAAHAREKAQHHTLVGTVQPCVTEAPYRARDEGVALVGRHRKIERDGAVEKGSQLGQRE